MALREKRGRSKRIAIAGERKRSRSFPKRTIKARLGEAVAYAALFAIFDMETTEEYRQRIIKTSDERKEFVTDVDGFVYWWPDGSPYGHLASHHLRWLAEELDRRNEKWQKNIDNYFSENAKDMPSAGGEPPKTQATY